MHPRFLADHDLNEHIIAGVLRREPAVEFVRARDLALADSPDDQILDRAAREEMIVVSHDVNTMPAAARRRISEGESVTGLMMVHQMDPIGPTIENLILIWAATQPQDWNDQICYLPL